jgi:hypothetical protein
MGVQGRDASEMLGVKDRVLGRLSEGSDERKILWTLGWLGTHEYRSFGSITLLTNLVKL